MNIETEPKNLVIGKLNEMADLVNEGKIKGLGTCIFSRTDVPRPKEVFATVRKAIHDIIFNMRKVGDYPIGGPGISPKTQDVIVFEMKPKPPENKNGQKKPKRRVLKTLFKKNRQEEKKGKKKKFK